MISAATGREVPTCAPHGRLRPCPRCSGDPLEEACDWWDRTMGGDYAAATSAEVLAAVALGSEAAGQVAVLEAAMPRPDRALLAAAEAAA